MKKNSVEILLLLIIILIGAFFRFYKLDWGQGLFTHPDEYYIVISANQLSFPDQMNPHFFNYGSFSIYLNYFTKQLSSISLQLSDLNPFLIGRFYSALFSTLTIPLIFLISLTFLNKKYSLLATALVALTPGLIQQAHFLTPESNLIFFIFLSLTFLLYFVKQKRTLFLLLASVSLGLALGIKVSSAVFFLPILLGIFLVTPKSLKSASSQALLISLISRITLSLFIILITLFIIDPYLFLDFQSFLSSFKYESALAMGTIPVFYTRQFINTIPVLFQLEKIYPFSLGPALLIFGILGIFYFIFIIFLIQQTYQNFANAKNWYILLLLIAFLSLFIPNAFLFAKWTRFISPTFPFFAIFSAFLLFKISQLRISKFLPIILNTFPIILTILWALAFFSIYTRDDVRLQTSNWIEQNLTPGTIFLEEGNMVDIPLPANFKRLSLNLYNLDENILTQQKLNEDLKQSDYIILQSRRVFANHQRLPQQFPKTAKVYNDLFSGSSGFTEIKEISSFPQLNLLGWKIEFPDEDMEETWSVFDHPVIRIFKKN